MKTILLLLFPICLAAQIDAARLEIEQINRSYAAMSQLHTEVDYLMFASHEATKPIESQRGTLWRNGDAYLYKLGPVESLTTSEFNINADHEDHELLLSRVRGTTPQHQFFGLELKAALDACAGVALSNPSPGIRLLRLDSPSPEIERAEFQFDAMSRKLLKVVLFYNEREEWTEDETPSKVRLEIVYRKQDERPVFPKDLFSIERFVQNNRGVFAPAPAFKGYQFFDNSGF